MGAGAQAARCPRARRTGGPVRVDWQLWSRTTPGIFFSRGGMLMNKRLHLALAALAATFIWAASSSAAIIVNDTWQDGERLQPVTNAVGGPYSENGADGDADNDIESVWYTSNAANMAASAG